MSKFIISGFADEISTDLGEQLATVKELGMHHIEMRNVNGKGIVNYSLNEAKEFKKQLDDAGVRLSAIGSPIGKIEITDDFAPHLDLFKHTLELAELLGAPYIRMFSFFINENEDPEKYTDEVLNRWYKFQEAAADSDVILLHENEKRIYGDVASRCKTLLDAMDAKKVRGIFDPANFVQCGEDTKKSFGLLRDKIIYMHIKDALSESGAVVPSGDGDGNVAYILQELVKSGYEGFLSLEPHLLTGDIAVCGVPMFKKAHSALMNIIKDLDVEIA